MGNFTKQLNNRVSGPKREARTQKSARLDFPSNFKQAERLLQRFERLLQHHGMSVAPGSRLEQAMLQFTEFRAINRRQHSIETDTCYSQRLLDSMGALELARAILSVERHPQFPQLLEHLRLVAEEDTVPFQNTRQLNDQRSRLVFELLIAALVMQFSEDVDLETLGGTSRSSNPDVLFRYQGQLWGIACKVMDTKNPKTLYQRLREGVEQIEKSPAERGFVLFNFKNVLGHEQLLIAPTEHGEARFPLYDSAQQAWEILQNKLDHMAFGIEETIPPQAIIAELFDKKAESVLATYVSFVSIVSHHSGSHRPAPAAVIYTADIGVRAGQRYQSLRADLNRASGMETVPKSRRRTPANTRP